MRSSSTSAPEVPVRPRIRKAMLFVARLSCGLRLDHARAVNAWLGGSECANRQVPGHETGSQEQALHSTAGAILSTLSASVSFQRLCIFGLYGAIQMLLLLL